MAHFKDYIRIFFLFSVATSIETELSGNNQKLSNWNIYIYILKQTYSKKEGILWGDIIDEKCDILYAYDVCILIRHCLKV